MGRAPRLLAGWGEWGRRQKNRIGRDRERALSLRRLCLSRADLFFSPPPLLSASFPCAYRLFFWPSLGALASLDGGFFCSISPSPFPHSSLLSSCLLVFLSSSIPLSRRSGIRCFLPPSPSLFRAGRRDGLLGRRREAMPEEHAAERSWADGSFCRVARPLSASSFFFAPRSCLFIDAAGFRSLRPPVFCHFVFRRLGAGLALAGVGRPLCPLPSLF